MQEAAPVGFKPTLFIIKSRVANFPLPTALENVGAFEKPVGARLFL